MSKKEKLLEAMKNNPTKAYYVIRALKSLGVYDEK